jgi:hypothetical protein
MDYNSKRYKVFGNNIRTGYPKIYFSSKEKVKVMIDTILGCLD